MTIAQLAKELSLDITVAGDLSREITGGYCGDFLSFVMGRAKEGDVWMTVMGNVNAIAVAVLTDAACILLVEDAALDEDARARAVTQGVSVLRSPLPAYDLAIAIHTQIGGICGANLL